MASFGGNREQRFSFADGWLFLEEFDIEGGSNGASTGVGGQSVVSDSPNHQVSPQCFLCGKTMKDDDMDLNQASSDDVGEEYCTCAETPRVIRQGGSGSGGGQVAVVENNAAGNLGGWSRRARMRQTPRRFEASVGSGSSNGIPTDDEAPITIVSNAIPTIANGIAPTTNGARPFRIRGIVSRRDTMLRSFGSGVEVNHSHSHNTVGGAATALSIWRTSPDGPALIINQFPNLHNMVPNTTRVEYDGSRFHVRIDGQEILVEGPSERVLTGDDGFRDLTARRAVHEMNYERLLSLQRQVGFVNTGLTEQFITRCLRRRYYRAPKNRPPAEAEACCICLVDFVNQDALGKIDCLHKFHFDCIKEWLMRKNVCPLCKEIALHPPNQA